MKTLKGFPEIVSDIELGIQFTVVLSPKQNIYHMSSYNTRGYYFFFGSSTAGIIFSLGPQPRVLLKIAKFHLNKSVPCVGIIRNAGNIRGRALYEEIRYEIIKCIV